MPKYRVDWNPIDDPTVRDLQERRDLEQVLQGEIADIYEETDEYLILEYNSVPLDPENLLARIIRIKKRMKPLPRPEQDDLLRQMLEVEDRIIKYSVFYWKRMTEWFGFSATRSDNPTEFVLDHGAELKEELLAFIKKIDVKKHSDTVEDLYDQLLKIERYIKEPSAYNFGKIIDDLREVFFEWRDDSTLDEKINRKIEKAREIIGKMSEGDIKTEAAGILNDYLEGFERQRKWRTKKQTENGSEPSLGTNWQEQFRIAERNRDLRLAYAVLQIFEKEPSRELVRRQRNEMARKYHPDVSKVEDDTNIKQIIAAYEMIKRLRGWK